MCVLSGAHDLVGHTHVCVLCLRVHYLCFQKASVKALCFAVVFSCIDGSQRAEVETTADKHRHDSNDH